MAETFIRNNFSKVIEMEKQVEAVSINNRASVLITPRDIGIESPNQKLSPEREEEAIKTISEILKKAGIL